MDDYLGIALSYLNLSETEFWEMRIKTFFLKLRFWQDLEDRRTKENAELVRLQTFYLVNIQLSKADKLQRPAELWQYDWDTDIMQKQAKTVSNEKAKRIIQTLINA